MGLLRGQVAQLAKLARSGDDRYLGEIVQIGFNAWHYADTNLWASLGDEIFERLAGPGEADDESRKRIRENLSERLQRRRELEAASDRAKEETVRLTSGLDKASEKRDVS